MGMPVSELAVLKPGHFLLPRRKTAIIKVPVVEYYDEEIQQCQEMYAKLQLDKPPTSAVQLAARTPFPMVRGRTTLDQPRPLTYTWRSNMSSRAKIRPYSIRSAPTLMLDDLDKENEKDEMHEGGKPDDVISDSTDYDCDKNGHGRRRTKMDPEQLSEYLNSHGFGLPKIVKPTNVYRRPSQSLPRGYNMRPLPKNPSQREKIKGRARLDQEMANMKALAFCEQQAPRLFRTASANMKNRDVQLMEEEMREHLHREGLDFEDGADDDNASIVMMPIKHEELVVRINTWMEQVENACRPYQQQQQELQSAS